MKYYLHINSDGCFTGHGVTADGIIPDGTILCTKATRDTSGPWTRVIDGKIIHDRALKSEHQRMGEAVLARGAALVALKDSDIIVIRCYEAGIEVPGRWADYRAILRRIARGEGDLTLPEVPAKPGF